MTFDESELKEKNTPENDVKTKVTSYSKLIQITNVGSSNKKKTMKKKTSLISITRTPYVVELKRLSKVIKVVKFICLSFQTHLKIIYSHLVTSVQFLFIAGRHDVWLKFNHFKAT